MLSVSKLTRLAQELVLFLLGCLLILLAATGRFSLSRHPAQWVVVGLALVLWGARASTRVAPNSPLWYARIRGASFALLGAALLGIALFPERFAGYLLETAGGVLTLRGLVTAVLLIRSA